MPSKIRLLVAEDSAYMQMAIRTMVKIDPSIEIVGEARDGAQAVELAALLRPDLITMDVNMPGLNGIEAVRRIMATTPAAILMLSSITDKGVSATLQALEAGAVDYVPKSISAVDMDLAAITTQLAGRIRFWGLGARAFAVGGFASPAPLPAETDLLVISGGAGSAQSAAAFLRDLGTLNCAVLVNHHDMPADATPAFVDHLSRKAGRPAREGSHRGVLSRGAITVMPGGREAALRRDAAGSLMLDFRNPEPAGEGAGLLRSALAVAEKPSLVVLSGQSGHLPPLLPAFSGRPGALWIQEPSQCSVPDQVLEAIGLGLPHVRLIPGAFGMTEKAA